MPPDTGTITNIFNSNYYAKNHWKLLSRRKTLNFYEILRLTPTPLPFKKTKRLMRSCSSSASFDAIEQVKYWREINAMTMTIASNLRFITTVFVSSQHFGKKSSIFTKRSSCRTRVSHLLHTVVSIIDAYPKLVYVEHFVVQRCPRYKN